MTTMLVAQALLGEVTGGTMTVTGITAGGLALVIGAIMKALKVGEARERAKRDVTIRPPVPTVTTREEVTFATHHELSAHIERTDQQIRDVWEAIQSERGVARTALGRIHERLDQQSKVTATLQGAVEEVGKNVGRLLDLALNRKPRAGA